MSEENTAQALTKNDFRQAVAQAGGPGAVLAAFDSLRLASAQLDKDYNRILEQYPPALDRHGASRHDSQRPRTPGLLG